MPEFENYLEQRIEALEAALIGASGLPAYVIPDDLGKVLMIRDAADAIFDLLPSGESTGGDYTISFDGSTTTAIPWDDDGTLAIAAMEALASVGAGNVLVEGGPVDSFQVGFQGDLSGTVIALDLLTADGSGLTGPGEPVTIDVSVDEEGGPEGPRWWELTP